MPRFSAASKAQLDTCHPDLQAVLNAAIEIMDFTVVEGHRGEAAQNAAFAKGASKLPWPLGNHNSNPSTAADIAPWPIDWGNDPKTHQKALERFVFLQGIVCACAHNLGIKVRFGIDWNQNMDMRDEGNFRDYPHVELVDPREVS